MVLCAMSLYQLQKMEQGLNILLIVIQDICYVIRTMEKMEIYLDSLII